MDDLFMPGEEPEQGNFTQKKSRFERDLEKYGSLNAVKAAKEAAEKSESSADMPSFGEISPRPKSSVREQPAFKPWEMPEDVEWEHSAEKPSAKPWEMPEDTESLWETFPLGNAAETAKNTAGSAAPVTMDDFGGAPALSEMEAIDDTDTSAAPEALAALDAMDNKVTADKSLADAAKEAEREAMRALEQLTGSISPDDNVVIDVNDIDTISAPVMSEMAEPEPAPAPMPRFKSRADTAYDVEAAMKTGSLPKLEDLSDEFGMAAKKKKTPALTEIKTKTPDEFVTEAQKVLSEQGIRSTDFSRTSRVSLSAVTNEKIRTATAGRTLLFISDFLSVILGIVGLIIVEAPDPVLFAGFIALSAAGIAGLVKFKFLRRFAVLCYLFSAASVLLLGLYKTAISVPVTTLEAAIPVIYYAIAIFAAFFGLGVMVFARSVRTYYNTNLRNERGYL